jgi:ATP diphosphatase
VLAKLREEIGEIEAELADNDKDRLEDEVGDLLFAAVNLARHLKVDADQALRRTNGKFERRFAAIEDGLAEEGRIPRDATLDEMEALWQRAKAAG